jgi:hypothetical protein
VLKVQTVESDAAFETFFACILTTNSQNKQDCDDCDRNAQVTKESAQEPALIIRSEDREGQGDSPESV